MSTKLPFCMLTKKVALRKAEGNRLLWSGVHVLVHPQVHVERVA